MTWYQEFFEGIWMDVQRERYTDESADAIAGAVYRALKPGGRETEKEVNLVRTARVLTVRNRA